VSEEPIDDSGGDPPRVAGHNGRSWFRAWQDRIRDPSLTMLFILLLCAGFVAEPLAARGLPVARGIAFALALAAALIVVILSDRRGAIIMILLGLGFAWASVVFGAGWPPPSADVVRRGGDIVVFLALIWVVGHAVYAPGRITFHRLQGAIVIYLAVAMTFASAYGLILKLTPHAFMHLNAAAGGETETAALFYFSLTTLTTTGYGDIVPIDPFARSLANLESMVGVFYVAITVARLVTLELADRRR
jgi:hypothetical protein